MTIGSILRLDISGDKAIMRKLKGMVPAARKKVLSKAARTAMKPVLATAKSNAPKQSGALRKAIKLRAKKKNRRGVVGVSVAVGAKWFVGDEFYGAFQEFGWKSGPRKVQKEWKISAKRAVERKAQGLKINSTDADGTAWVNAWRRTKPIGVESRVNATSQKRFDRRREIPGKHFIEQAYQTGGERALKSFMDEVPREIEKLMAAGGKK